jgi:hypothetical protein
VWRRVQVADRHTTIDYAVVPKDLSDTHFPDAKSIILVQDNLNTHVKASLYQAYPAAESRRLVERFEWRYTPKHGAWLDLAESDLAVSTSQRLDRRIRDKQTLTEEVDAWGAIATTATATPRAIGASTRSTPSARCSESLAM